MRSLRTSLRILTVLGVCAPFLVTGAWLSDKDGGTSGSSGSTGTGMTQPAGNRTPHNYLYPTVPVSDSSFPAVTLINAKYDADSRQLTIAWQDSIIKRDSLPTTSVSAFGPRISWDNQGMAEFRYVIFRHTERIDSIAKYYQARQVGIVPAGQGRFVEAAPPAGSHYYAIGILDRSDTEYFKPLYDQSFTSEPVTVGDQTEPAAGLNAAYNPGNNTVTLNWTHPQAQQTAFQIYIAQEVINNDSRLSLAISLERVGQGQTSYTYSPKQGGSFFYAVIPFGANNTSNRTLTTGNATQFPLVVNLPVTDPAPVQITGINAFYNPVSKIMNVRWQYRDNTRPGLRLYLNHKGAINNPGILGSSMLIKDLPPQNGLGGVDISASGPGEYFLAVVSYNASGQVNQALLPGENFLHTPIVIPGGAAPTNLVYQTNNVFITNITPVFHTNYREIPIYLTNAVTVTNTTGTVTNTVYETNQLYLTNMITITNVATNTNLPAGTNQLYLTNMVYLTNQITNTNMSSATNLIWMTNMIYLTNQITNTNIVQLTNTNWMTNMVYLTNQITNTNYTALTNQLYVTNLVYQTNQLYLTNLVSLTNQLYLTNLVFQTNQVTNMIASTNLATLTNMVYLTNYQTIYLTNRVNVPDQGTTRRTTRRQYRDPSADQLTLRRTVQLFFRSRDTSNRAGLRQSIASLKRIHDNSRDQSTKDQCMLFMGRAYYALGEYLTAFRHFVAIQHRLPEESRFWIRQCVGKMR